MKGLLIATVLGGLACAFFGLMLGMKHTETKAEVQTIQSQVTVAQTSARKAKQELDEAVTAKDEATSKLEAAEAKVGPLETELASLKSKVTEFETAKNDAEKARDEAVTELAELKEKFSPDDNPELLKEQIASQEEKIAALDEEKKILEEEVSKAKEEVLKVRALVERMPEGDLPPGVSGRIAKVNRDWNFVVLDIGYNSGVVPNGELVVYRGNQMIGRVKVTSASPDTAVANILPEWQQAPMRPGDKVLNGTKS